MSARAKSQNEQQFLLTGPWGVHVDTQFRPLDQGVVNKVITIRGGKITENGDQGLCVENGGRIVLSADCTFYAQKVKIRARAITMI